MAAGANDEFPSADDRPWGPGTLDAGRADAAAPSPPFEIEGGTDAEVVNVTPGDGGADDPRDAELNDASRPDGSAEDAGAVISDPDGGGKVCENTLLPGERRDVGEYLCSRNGRYRFGLSSSGDLELRSSEGVLWSSGTCCAQKLAMQRDGNLVSYAPGDAPVFATNTRGNDGAFLVVEDEGRAVLKLGGNPIWSTAAAK